MTGPQYVGNHSRLIVHLEYETKLATLNVLILSLCGGAFDSGFFLRRSPAFLGRATKLGSHVRRNLEKTLVDFLSESGV